MRAGRLLRESMRTDTPADVASRRAHRAALDAALADVAARFPLGVTVENAREYAAMLDERQRARVRELLGGAR